TETSRLSLHDALPICDGVRDAFAADQAGADEVEGVGPVGFGAGGADGGAAVFAGHVEHPVGHVVGDALDLAATIRAVPFGFQARSEEYTSELQSREKL